MNHIDKLGLVDDFSLCHLISEFLHESGILEKLSHSIEGDVDSDL